MSTVQGADILLSLFADETDISTVTTQATSECIDSIVNELTEFGSHSGCKANVSKTRCTPLGKARHVFVALTATKTLQRSLHVLCSI